MAISTYYLGARQYEPESSSRLYLLEKLESLGKGNQAEVFLVKDASGDLFALKCFFSKEEKISCFPAEALPFLFEGDGTPISALQEWEVARQLDHPNLLRYHKLTRGPETTLLMEYILGTSLADIPSGTLNLSVMLSLLAEAADVLQYAFSQGWIHRDLHSTNAMVDSEQHLKLIDLGSFSLLESSAEVGETLEDEQEKLLYFFSSILDKGHLTAEKKEEIVQILHAPFTSPEWEAQKQSQLCSTSASLLAQALCIIADRVKALSGCN